MFDLRHGFDIVNLPKSVTLFVNLLAASGLFAVSALAQDASKTPAKADVVKGQAIASQACAACHGADGNSNSPANPKLAGQHADYLYKQLTNFKPKPVAKEAERSNAVMLAFASQLSDADMRNVSAYFASQTLKPAAARNKDIVELGQKIYRGGIASKTAASAGSSASLSAP